MNFPNKIFAGDKLEVTEYNSNFLPSAGWTAKYILINQSNKYTIESAADNDNHKFTIDSSVTGAWVAANYTCQLYYENTDGTTDGIERIDTKVKPNLIIAATYDTRTDNEILLDAVIATLKRRATKEQMNMTISTADGGTKALQYIPMQDLIKIRNDLYALVEGERTIERLKSGKKAGHNLSVRFNNSYL